MGVSFEQARLGLSGCQFEQARLGIFIRKVTLNRPRLDILRGCFRSGLRA